MKKRIDLTEAPIGKSLMVLSLPIIFANILHMAYTLIDTFWVGRLGANAVAAVSMSFPILFLMLSLGMGLGIAGTIMVAQYKGKKDLKKVDHISAQMFLMMFFVSLVLSIAGYFASGPILELMGADPSFLADATNYLQVLFVGMIFMFMYFVFGALMRGVGDVITPMIIMLITVILNAILDPIFIMGWWGIKAYGVSGAAIVTIMTEGLAGLVGLLMLFTNRYGIRLKIKNFKPDFKLMYKMFRLGLPSSIEQSIRAIAMSLMFYLVAGFGTQVVAAYGIGTRILSFAIIPSIGIATATSTLVGQNMGAGKIDRAEKVSWLSSGIGFGVLTIFGILTFFYAGNLAGFFLPGEPEVIAESVTMLKIIALTFGFMSVQQVLSGALKGAGDTMIPMILTIITTVAILFPLAYVLSALTELGQIGIWWSYPITYIIGTIITLIWFIRGKWKTIKITEEYKEQENLTAAFIEVE
ncbi:MATE family efflux transporter [Candidatus Peregrinibacteria bacterium]|nr:MATE family efflux transporter [Candidatus Peregrinibacteria bacterium]